MSRRWQRMVERNTKAANRLRAKSGQAPIGAKAEDERIRGRSWVFPLVLAAAGILFGLTVPPAEAGGLLHQITVALYLLLAFIHFFLRRPFLRIGKRELAWRTYSGERIAKAEEIESIEIGERKSIVRLKDGKTKRSFSKVYHLYPMERINEALASFAAAHGIPVNHPKRNV